MNKLENINLICLTGLFLFYLPKIFYYKSVRALVVFINGILYHTNKNNIFLRNYDIYSNILLICWTVYNYNSTIYTSLFVLSSFTINNYLNTKNYINENVSNFIHLFLVQFPLSISLKNTLIDQITNIN